MMRYFLCYATHKIIMPFFTYPIMHLDCRITLCRCSLTTVAQVIPFQLYQQTETSANHKRRGTIRDHSQTLVGGSCSVQKGAHKVFDHLKGSLEKNTTNFSVKIELICLPMGLTNNFHGKRGGTDFFFFFFFFRSEGERKKFAIFCFCFCFCIRLPYKYLRMVHDQPKFYQRSQDQHRVSCGFPRDN